MTTSTALPGTAPMDDPPVDGGAADDRALRAAAAATLLGAAALHASVVTEHAEEWGAAGTFFVALQLVETLLALAVLAGCRRRTAVAVVATSLGTVAVWLVSRTTGLPLGPPSSRGPEGVGRPDLVCGLLELGAAALVLPRALGRTSLVRPGLPGMRGGALVVLAAALTAWALATGGGHGEHGATRNPQGPPPSVGAG